MSEHGADCGCEDCARRRTPRGRFVRFLNELFIEWEKDQDWTEDGELKPKPEQTPSARTRAR